MNAKQPHQRLKVRTRAQTDFRRYIYGAFVAILGIVVALLTPAGVQASVSNHRHLADGLNSVKPETVGYQQPHILNLADIAKDAYQNDHYHLARRLWSALAEEGDADAAFRLGMLYDTGVSVERDPVEAASWYQRAAVAGNLEAQHNLAVAYANGEGVEMDIKKALHWWKHAAQRGNADSQYNLGIVYAMGVHGVKRSIDDAKKWWRKAAIKGDPMAQYNLGTIYANGEGHVKSYCEATRWWEKSARRGIEQASWALQIIKQRDDYKACW